MRSTASVLRLLVVDVPGGALPFKALFSMKTWSTALFSAALIGCQTAPTALTPTPVACAPKNSPQPPATTANADLAKLDDRSLVLTIASERLDLIDYAGKAAAIIAACQ